MTDQITPGSPRRAAAQRYGRELRRAMTSRKVGSRTLATAALVTTAMVHNYLCGRNLPQLATGQRIAQALDSDTLARLIVECRTERCAVCGDPFVSDTGTRRLCSPRCETIAVKRRRGADPKYELVRVQRTLADVEGELEAFRAAIAEYCGDCEPEGTCRTPRCALRLVSPLPLVADHRAVTIARPGDPAERTEEQRERQRLAVTAANRRRAASSSAFMQARLAAMSEPERAAWSQRLTDARTKRFADDPAARQQWLERMSESATAARRRPRQDAPAGAEEVAS